MMEKVIDEAELTVNQKSQSDRRFSLVTVENPNLSIDYLVSLGSKLTDESCCIQISYVPDKLVLKPEAFEQYLHSFDDQDVLSLEALALNVLIDLNNEVVPRWVQVRAKSESSNHRVLVEDRQPIWENEELLSRIQKF
ncbi:hypothetical protein [Curvivirga sp.]|uniref:hypothetical protein n=1 Tax=Curvivirga sp. TaxID=2856848 RepID=UPI003B5A633D